jgi:hypothetical protein
MLPFFRKIRYRLAEENQFLKYSRYAIGEIVLVVIGILIALYINNWNELRIEKQKEQALLHGLQETFANNLENLNFVIADTRIAFESSKKVLDLLGTDHSGYSDAELDTLLGHMINYTTYDPSTGTIDNIINSGTLNIIRNKELKDNISNWSGMLNDAEKDIEIANNHAFKILLPYLNDKVNLKNLPIPRSITERTGLNISRSSHFPVNYATVMGDKKFENLLDFHAVNFIYLMREYIELKEYLEHNLALIADEIENSPL